MVHWGFVILAFFAGFAICYFILYKVSIAYVWFTRSVHRGARLGSETVSESLEQGARQ